MLVQDCAFSNGDPLDEISIQVVFSSHIRIFSRGNNFAEIFLPALENSVIVSQVFFTSIC